MTDVFIVHEQADRQRVDEELIPALDEKQITSLTPDDFHFGAIVLDEFVRTLDSCRAAVIVLSDTTANDRARDFLTQLFSRMAVLRAEEYTQPVFPVMLDQCEPPPWLKERLRPGLDGPVNPTQIAAEISRTLDLRNLAPPEKPPCPFPGMQPFTSDKQLFGRDEETNKLITGIEIQGLIVVIGSSGVGKSSLLVAGVAPKLREMGWAVLHVRPGSSPIQSIRHIVPDDDDARAGAVEELRASSERLVVILDPFEEVFSPTVLPADVEDFCARINWLRQPASNVCVLAAIRADFYGALLNSPLHPIDASEKLDIGPLRADRLRAAIVGPARRTNPPVHIELRLLDQLVKECDAEANALPFLQDLLVGLWRRMGDMKLTMEHLAAVAGAEGGLRTILKHRTDSALRELRTGEQGELRTRIARQILLRLVQFVEGRPNTRRQVSVDGLGRPADSPEAFDATLEHLTEHRLVTRTRDMVDLSHEALLSVWEGLRDLPEKARDAEEKRRQLLARAKAWEGAERRGHLLDEAELYGAKQWEKSANEFELGIDKIVADYLVASGEEIERRHRRAQVIRHALVSLTVIALVAGGFAFFMWVAADKRKEEAEVARFEAEARKCEADLATADAMAKTEEVKQKTREAWSIAMAARSRTSPHGRIDDALLFAVQAAPMSAKLHVDDALLWALDRDPGLLRVLVPDGPAIVDLEVSVDSSTLYAVDSLGTVRGWDTDSWTALPGSPWSGPDASGRPTDVTPNGDVLYLDRGAVARLWRPRGHAIVSELELASSSISARISDDGRHVAAISGDGGVELWDMDGPRPSRRTKWPGAEGRWLSFETTWDPVHDLLTVVYLPPTGGVQLIRAPRTGPALGIGWDPVHDFDLLHQVASCGSDTAHIVVLGRGNVYRYEISEGSLDQKGSTFLRDGAWNADEVEIAEVSWDCRHLLVGLRNGTLSALDLTTDKESDLTQVGFLGGAISSIAFPRASEDGWFAAGTASGLVVANSDSFGDHVPPYVSPAEPLDIARDSPDRLAVGAGTVAEVVENAEGDFVRVHRAGIEPADLRIPAIRRVTGTAISPDGNQVAILGSAPGSEQIWTIQLSNDAGPQPIQVAFPRNPKGVSISSIGLVMWYDGLGAISVIDREGSASLIRSPPGCEASAPVLAQDAALVAFHCGDMVYVIDAMTGGVKHAESQPVEPLKLVLFSHVGLLLADLEGSIGRISLGGSTSQRSTLGPFGSQVSDLAVSATGSRLALALDGRVQLWDVERNSQIGPAYVTHGEVLAVSFDANDDLVAYVDVGGRVQARRWTLSRERLLQMACERMSFDARTRESTRDWLGNRHEPCDDVPNAPPPPAHLSTSVDRTHLRPPGSPEH